MLLLGAVNLELYSDSLTYHVQYSNIARLCA
jgi:hypothetical protein